jgi:hypothetical protein
MKVIDTFLHVFPTTDSNLFASSNAIVTMKEELACCETSHAT